MYIKKSCADCCCDVVQVWDAADVLIKAAEPLTTSDTKTVSEWTRQMATLPQASKLATRILLLTLLFEVTKTIHVESPSLTILSHNDRFHCSSAHPNKLLFLVW